MIINNFDYPKIDYSKIPALDWWNGKQWFECMEREWNNAIKQLNK